MNFHFFKWGFWITINNHTLFLARDYPRYFSEREGYRKVHRMGRWALEFRNSRKV